MSYVTFRDPKTGREWRSDTDLGLILESVSVGSPAVRKRTVSVPGANTVLDCTEALGFVTYDPRPVAISVGKTIKDRFAQDSLVKNALHGRLMEIILSEDPGYYYFGRISVGEWVKTNGIGHAVISADCDPHKYRQSKTSITAVVPDSGTTEVMLYNDFMLAVPTITATAAAEIVWKEHTYNIAAGTAYRNLDIELTAGENVLQVTAKPGTAITVEYQEGSL